MARIVFCFNNSLLFHREKATAYESHHLDLMQTVQMLLIHDIELSAVRIPPANFLITLVCAEPPTRDTEIPGFTAGRIPELNKLDSKKI